MQEKNFAGMRAKDFEEVLCLHLHRHYREAAEPGGCRGLKAFCEKYGISYNSARKVQRGSTEYPGVKADIIEAMGRDGVDVSCIQGIEQTTEEKRLA